MKQSLYVYKAELVRVVDGDTYDFHVDTGFYSRYSNRFRLQGYDTPEVYRGTDFEKQQATLATEFVKAWFEENPEFYIRTFKADSFGRWLAHVYTDKSNLGELLVEQELASRWPVRWREQYDS